MPHSLSFRAAPVRVPACALVLLAACGGDASDPVAPTTPAARVAEVRVSPAVTEVTLGQTTQLGASPRDASGRPMSGVAISWRSLDGQIASVDATGKVTGAALGVARVEASAAGYTDTATVTVKASGGGGGGTPGVVASVSVEPGTVSLRPGTTGQLTAILRDAMDEPVKNVTVTWSTENAAVVTVTQAGVIQGVALGSARIVAAAGGRADTALVTVAEPPPPSPPASALTVSQASASLTVGQEVRITATPRDGSGAAMEHKIVTWTSANRDVATVSSSGLIRGVAAGSTTITARVDNVSATVTVTVTNPAPQAPTVASVTIAPSPVSLDVGGTRQLAATAHDANGSPMTGVSVTWSGGSGTIATVSASGLVTAHGVGTTSVTATAGGKSATVQVTVTAPPQQGTRTTIAVTAGELGSVGGEDGDPVLLPDVMLAGDDDEFGLAPLQAFVTYSLTGVAAGATIESAHLPVTMDAFGVFGNPFSLGSLYVERATSLALQTQPVGSGSILVASALTPSSSVDVTALVKAAIQAGETSITFRFRFTQMGNGNGATDQLEFSTGSLGVTFVK